MGIDWKTSSEILTLNAGNNTIEYKYDTTDTGNINIDDISLEEYVAPPTPDPIPDPTPSSGYGATVPYDTYEAESSNYFRNCHWTINNFRNYSFRSFWKRSSATYRCWTICSSYFEQTCSRVVVRYSIPDNASGTGIDSAISMYINGNLSKDINLTSKYSWNYGNWSSEPGEIRWSNNPNANPTTPHEFFDEVSVDLGTLYPAGTVIKLQRNASNLNFGATSNVTVDSIETEEIPAALTKPSNYLSIEDYGAVANDSNDDTTALNNCINAVKSSNGAYKGVWIPVGNFIFNNGNKGAGYNLSGTRIYLDSGISMKGAGMWYSTLSGDFAGIYLKDGNVTLSDFKISANDVIRDDYNGVSGVEGNGTNSTICNLWIEHTKVGVWLTNQTNSATVSGSRFRNIWADGINLH